MPAPSGSLGESGLLARLARSPVPVARARAAARLARATFWGVFICSARASRAAFAARRFSLASARAEIPLGRPGASRGTSLVESPPLFLVILGLAGYRHVAYRPWSVRVRAPAFLPRPGPLRSRAPRQHSGLNLSLVLVLVVSARTRFLLNMPRRPQSAPASSILPDSGLNLPLCPQSVLNLASICPSVLHLSSMRP